MQTNKKRFLIVYENMGSGHRRMARILTDMLEPADDIEVTATAGSELLGSSSVDAIVFLWNYFIRKDWIRTVDAVINFFTRLVVLPALEVSDTPKFLRKLEELDPDAIISTADGFNKVLGTYAASKGIPFYIFITDISIFLDLVHPSATHICYFPETAAAVNSYDFKSTYFAYTLSATTGRFAKARYVLGYLRDYLLNPFHESIFRNTSGDLPKRNGARTLVIGPLAERKHFAPKDRARLREKLGFADGEDTALIASGSIGGRLLLDTVDLLWKGYAKPLHLLVMCGNDADAYRKLEGRPASRAGVRVTPFEFVNNLDEFLAVTDCVIARPSAGIFIESLVNRTPTIALGPIPSNDKGSLTIIEQHSTGEVCARRRDLPVVVGKVLANRVRYVENIERLLNRFGRTYEEKAETLLAEFRGKR